VHLKQIQYLSAYKVSPRRSLAIYWLDSCLNGSSTHHHPAPPAQCPRQTSSGSTPLLHNCMHVSFRTRLAELWCPLTAAPTRSHGEQKRSTPCAWQSSSPSRPTRSSRLTAGGNISFNPTANASPAIAPPATPWLSTAIQTTRFNGHFRFPFTLQHQSNHLHGEVMWVSDSRCDWRSFTHNILLTVW
jgi:hypothetical protein